MKIKTMSDLCKGDLAEPSDDKLYLKDGREIHIQIWEPRAVYNDVTTVKVTGVIMYPQEGPR